MDVSSLYTNIDHEEGAQACFNALEKRKDQKVPSTLLKKLILLVLKSNIFRFNHQLYRQIKGTAMGTPMAVNYANLFLDDLETKMLNDYEKKTKLRPLFWFRYIDDIFFVWNHGEETLKDFIDFCDKYSSSKKMKSNIRYESNASSESVNFLDVQVKLVENSLVTNLYSKPTDAHLYLNANSSHPSHVIRNIPKGQFIRVRRICSRDESFDFNAKLMMKFFVSRGYKERYLQKVVKEVRSMSRENLLKSTTKGETGKDTHSIFVCTWHPKLSQLPSILNENYNILDNDAKLRKIFTEKPTVAFRRKKNLENHLCRKDIKTQEVNDTNVATDTKCKCQVCKLLVKSESITNSKNDLTLKKKPGGTCRSTGVVYAMKCKKCHLLYIGHSEKDMRDRYGKHKYDIKSRPKQNELAAHFHKDHHIEDDLEIHILDYGIHHLGKRTRMEDRLICKLQTMSPHGMNELVGPYAREMYAS